MDQECQFVCELKELAPATALVIRAHATVPDIPALFESGFGEMEHLLQRQGKKPSSTSFAHYYGINEGKIDVEFGYLVDESVHGGGRAVTGSTPSGKAAACEYIGPYAEIEPAYTALMKWVSDNGLTMNGEAYEIYLNDPFETPPELLRTQVHLLLRDD